MLLLSRYGANTRQDELPVRYQQVMSYTPVTGFGTIRFEQLNQAVGTSSNPRCKPQGRISQLQPRAASSSSDERHPLPAPLIFWNQQLGGIRM